MSDHEKSTTGKGDNRSKIDSSKRKNPNNKFFRGTKFEGACEELKGSIFDCHTSKSKQIDEYNKTVDRIKVYVSHKIGSLIGKAVTDLQSPTLAEPNEPQPDPQGNIPPLEMKKWEKKYGLYLSKTDNINEGLRRLHALVWGQCSEAMQSRLQEMHNFNTIGATLDGIELLKTIRNIAFSYKTHDHPVVAMHSFKYDMYRLSQSKHQTTQDFYDSFVNMVNVNESIGNNIGTDDGMLMHIMGIQNVNYDTATPAQRRTAAAIAKQRYLAVAMLYASDKTRYGGLIEELRNDYLKGKDNYPTTLDGCFTLLNHWNRDPRNVPGQMYGRESGMAFTNIDGENQTGEVNLNDGKYKGPPCE